MDLFDKLKLLPKSSGCYLMKDINNVVIYVGKAKNLLSRVKSYFTGSHDLKTERLVQDIKDFEFIITTNEKEALILEINLIKKYLPYYNILLTDDKTYPYIVLTNETHPKVMVTRELKRKGKYFGPYPNVTSARVIIQVLNKLYPLRKCNKIPKRECLYYHIHNCLAPCIKKVEKKEYEEITSSITSLLNGKTSAMIKELTLKMNQASEELNYEKAIEIRNIIKELETVCEKQKMETKIFNADVFNYSVKDDFICIQVFHIRDYKLLERTGVSFEVFGDVEETFCNYINQFYLLKNNPIPKEIITTSINTELIHADLVNKIIIPVKGIKKELVDLVLVNINKELENLVLKAVRSYEYTEGACLDLAKLLNIKSAKRIESYDNSNILGINPVSAMVVFENGIKKPKEYRKYKITSVEGPNESKTFKEVIKRRYTRLLEENQVLSDLIIMDGGAIQVNACCEVLKQLNLDIPVIGLIKDKFHKTSSILYLNKTVEIKNIKNVYKLLSLIQEEVHNFAITYFKKSFSKSQFSSMLDSIPGIGEVKKRKIQNILGSDDFELELKNINLNQEQIEQILKIYNLK